MKTEESFARELWAIMLPVALQSLLSSLVSSSDALMLGLLDQSSLSAISLAAQVAFVLSLFHMAFTTGASVLSAQYWGMHDKDTVERVLGISLKISLPVSAGFAALALFTPGLLMRVFTSDVTLIQMGIPYLRIVSVSYLLTGFTQMYLNIMKNSGRVAQSSLYGSVTVVSNILLNLLLIFGWLGLPALGIRGAALATVISRVIELALCLWENRKAGEVRFKTETFLHTDRALAKDYWRYTTPVFLNFLVWGGGITMFSVIMGHLGSDAVAANSITNIIKNLLLSFCTGVGAGSGIMIGNRLGAGKLEEARSAGNKLLAAALICGTAVGCVLLVLVPCSSVFSRSLTEQAGGYLKIMLAISSYAVLGKSINSTLVSGIFTAGGDTRFGFYCDLITMWCMIIPLSAFAAFALKWPVPVVYFLLNLDEIGKIPVVIRHFRKYKWVKNLTGKEQST